MFGVVVWFWNVAVPPEVLKDWVAVAPTEPELAFTNCAAIWAARLESMGVRTDPVRMMALPAISLRTLEPGIRRRSRLSNAERSAPTATISVKICWPCSSKKKALVCPAFFAMRKTRSDYCTTASKIWGSEIKTSLRGPGN